MRLGALVCFASAAIGSVLPGCSAAHDVSPSDAGVTPDAGRGDGGPTGALPEGFCATACVTTAESSCFSPRMCAEYCGVHVDAWPSEVGAAFARCAAEDPLCFQTVEGCILSTLQPRGSLHTVRLQGSGLGEHDGRTVRVWHDPGRAMPFGGEAVITGGAFSFEWEEPVDVTVDGASLMLLYIDVDGDGACTGSVDVTAAVSPAWNGDYLEPVFATVLAPPLSDPDFVCDFAP